MRAVATGGDGARGATSGVSRRDEGDERETDFFDVDRRDAEDEPNFYVQNKGLAFHLAGLRASSGGEVI